MTGLLDFNSDGYPSILSGNNSILWGNRVRHGTPHDAMPALFESAHSPSNARERAPPAQTIPPAPLPMPIQNPGGEMPNAPAGLLANYHQEPHGGLLTGLQDVMVNPLFLTGLGLLSGEGFGGAMRGAQLGFAMQEQKNQRSDKQRQEALLDHLMNTTSAPPEIAQIAGMQGPQAGANTLLEWMGPAQKARELDLEYKRSQIANNNARANWYREGAGGNRTGQTERIIERLMESNPELSYEDAVGLARRAPQDDSMRLERLAMDAYRNDPGQTLEEWRAFYGLGKRETPAAAAPAEEPGSGRPPNVPPGARQAPDGNWYVSDPDRPGKYLKVN